MDTKANKSLQRRYVHMSNYIQLQTSKVDRGKVCSCLPNFSINPPWTIIFDFSYVRYQNISSVYSCLFARNRLGKHSPLMEFRCIFYVVFIYWNISFHNYCLRATMPWNSAERISICYAMEGVSFHHCKGYFLLNIFEASISKKSRHYPQNHCYL